MTTWKNSLRNFWIAVRYYLAQHLCEKNKTTALDPWKFDRYNKIRFLENCWELTYSSREKHS